MPICNTCRGEYVYEECLCPSCFRPVGRGMNLCHNCGATTHGTRLCPRCKSDVVAWEQESFPLVQFIRRGGVLGLLPSLAALVVWIAFWWPRGASLHHPLVTVVAIGFSQLLLVLLYVTRLGWREAWWAFQVYQVPRLSLPVAIAVSFVGGILTAVLSFILYKVWQPPVELWQQLIFGLVYASTYVLFTVALTLFAVHDYVHRLDRRVPQPIFVHTERLLRVALESALRSLRALEGDSVHKVPLDGDPSVRYEIVEVSRIPETGGVRTLLHISQRADQPEEGKRSGVEWVEKLWRVEADRWGRVHSVRPG